MSSSVTDPKSKVFPTSTLLVGFTLKTIGSCSEGDRWVGEDRRQTRSGRRLHHTVHSVCDNIWVLRPSSGDLSRAAWSNQVTPRQTTLKKSNRTHLDQQIYAADLSCKITWFSLLDYTQLKTTRWECSIPSAADEDVFLLWLGSECRRVRLVVVGPITLIKKTLQQLHSLSVFL